MFFHTHVYAAQKITGRDSSLLIYGSILPDIAVTKIAGWDDISKRAEEFRNWLILKDGRYADLGLGMMLHEYPCGIDRFTHSSYNGNKGYAFENSGTIVRDVSVCLGITLEQAKIVAHNFIETGVEFFIVRDNSSVVKLLRKSISNVDINQIAKYFSEFYGTEKQKTIKAFESYNELLMKFDYGSVDGLVDMWASFANYLFDKPIERSKTKAVIEKSIAIVKPTYKKFISDAVEQCKKDVKKYD